MCVLKEENIARRPRIAGRDDPVKGMEKNALRKMLEGLTKVRRELCICLFA